MTDVDGEGSDRAGSDDRWAGMDTGSEAGAPGEHLPEPPLTAEERAMLSALRSPEAGEGTATEALEDRPEVARAADGDEPLPPADLPDPGDAGEADGGDTDPDTPRFRAPGA